MLPACLGGREINKRKIALALLKFLLWYKWSLTTNKELLLFPRYYCLARRAANKRLASRNLPTVGLAYKNALYSHKMLPQRALTLFRLGFLENLYDWEGRRSEAESAHALCLLIFRQLVALKVSFKVV